MSGIDLVPYRPSTRLVVARPIDPELVPDCDRKEFAALRAERDRISLRRQLASLRDYAPYLLIGGAAVAVCVLCPHPVWTMLLAFVSLLASLAFTVSTRIAENISLYIRRLERRQSEIGQRLLVLEDPLRKGFRHMAAMLARNVTYFNGGLDELALGYSSPGRVTLIDHQRTRLIADLNELRAIAAANNAQ